MIKKILAFIYPNDIESQETYKKIKYEILNDIFATLFWHLIFIPVFVFLYASMLLKSVDTQQLLLWYSSIFITFLLPVGFVYRQYNHASPKLNLFKAERTLAASAGITSFIVGISSWLFFDYLPENMAMFMVISLSLGPAVSAAAFAGSMRIWLSITTGLMLPVISYVYFKLEFANVPGSVFAFWLLLYSIYMFFVAYRQHKSLRENLILKHQLQQAIQNKSRYMAAASHDIRQPLHAMSYFVHSLKEEFKDHPTFQKLQRSLESLNSLMDSLLDISRLESNMIKVNIEPVALFDTLQELNNQFSQIAQNKQISLSFESEQVYAKTDKILLSRILGNLIDNALKYTQAGGHVGIRCYKRDDNIILSISDTGSGIAAEEQSKIFDEFYQIKNKQIKKNHGLGLGLAIVYKMAQLAKIQITLESSLGNGSCFTLSLQNSSLQPVPAKTLDEEITAETNNITIGVIDDQQSILDALSLQLSSWGYQCITAPSSESFCEKSKNKTIDLLLCDFILQEENGVDAINKVRQQQKTNLPAIIITASTDNDSLNQIQKTGFTILKKPVKPALLRATIIRYCKH